MAREYRGEGLDAYRVVAVSTSNDGASSTRVYGPYASAAAARGIATGIRGTAKRYTRYGSPTHSVETRIERSPLGDWQEVAP